MKKIRIKSKTYGEQVLLVDDEDYERVASLMPWTVIKNKGKHNLYAKKRRPDNTTLLLHQFILGTDTQKGVIIDHINRNGLDNRKNNLRITSNADNVRNSRRPITNTSGYKGVAFHKPTKKWRAYITVFGKQLHLGLFKDIEEANIARKKADKKYFDTSKMLLEK